MENNTENIVIKKDDYIFLKTSLNTLLDSVEKCRAKEQVIKNLENKLKQFQQCNTDDMFKLKQRVKELADSQGGYFE